MSTMVSPSADLAVVPARLAFPWASGGPGTISRLAHGAYHLPGHPVEDWMADLAEACARAPGAVICLGSAAYFELLVDQPPPRPWLAIGGLATTDHGSRGVPRTLVTGGVSDLMVGVINDMLHGLPIRRTNAARTAVDLVRHASRVGGMRSGIEAIRRVIAVEGCADPILAMVRELRIPSDVRQTIDTLVRLIGRATA